MDRMREVPDEESGVIWRSSPKARDSPHFFDGYELASSETFERVSRATRVCRAIRKSDAKPVYLKIVEEDVVESRDLKRKVINAISRLKAEYGTLEYLREQKVENAIRAYALERLAPQTLGLVIEDFGGKSLRTFMKESILQGDESRVFPLETIISIATRVSETLRDIHKARVIHKDVNPSNIVYNPSDGTVKLIDFGISTRLRRQDLCNSSIRQVEGTFAYISPEQTGRTNRLLDYRTDFYSLGCTLYHLIAGELPFMSKKKDVMELVHFHIAREATPLHVLCPDVPRMLSDVVSKLMEKMPEKRYQSAAGVCADLCLCEDIISGKCDADMSFELGQHEVLDHLEIPEKLYGREAQVKVLMKRFDVIASGKEMVLVSGHSGIGKTFLVREIISPIRENGGHFISGKFDQYHRHVPYSAIVAALSQFVHMLLIEPETQLRSWKTRFISALGTLGKVVIDVIPEFELVVGAQPELEELSPSETKQRFEIVFEEFMGVFCRKGSPLVIFLDDLQWVDPASLALIELIMSNEKISSLLFIGAYRHNEVGPDHPLVLPLQRIREKVSVVDISLNVFRVEDVQAMLQDSLHTSEVKALELAKLILKKTEGNPFFTHQFLRRLYEQGILYFDGVWKWDEDVVNRSEITDNVVELVIQKLKEFPEGTQRLLKYASIIGNRFDLRTLSIIVRQPVNEMFNELLLAVDSGIVLPLSQSISTWGPDSNMSDHSMKFLHDKVQQAAYALIDQDERIRIHFKMGNLLLDVIDEGLLFSVVNHLSCSRDLIETSDGHLVLAQVCHEAALRSRDAMANDSALTYIRTAMDELNRACRTCAEALDTDVQLREFKEFISRKSQETMYTFVMDVVRCRITVEYLNGNFDQSEEWIRWTVEHARSSLERVIVYHMLIVQYTLRAKYLEAIDTARKALAVLDIHLPLDDPQVLASALQEESETVFSELEKHPSVYSLIDLPGMTSKEGQVAMKVLTAMGPPCYRYHQRLWAVIVCKQMNLCLKYGNVPSAAYTYTSFGGLQGHLIRKYDNCKEYANLGVEVCRKFPSSADESVAHLMIGSSLTHWMMPMKQAFKDYMNAYEVGLHSGNLQYSAYAFGHNCYSLLFRGTPLPTVSQEVEKSLNFSLRKKNQWSIDVIRGCQYIVDHLRSGDEVEDDMKREALIGNFEKNRSVQPKCIFCILYAFSLLLEGELEKAYEWTCEAEKELFRVATQGLLPSAEHVFIRAAVIAALLHEKEWMDDETRSKPMKKQLEEYLKLLKIWKKAQECNFGHKYLFIKAEIAWLEGRETEVVVDLFLRSIQCAERSEEFLHHRGMAHARLSQLWTTKNKMIYARVHIVEALSLYERWGAQSLLSSPSAASPGGRRASQTSIDIPPWLVRTTTMGTAPSVAFDETLVPGSLDIFAVMKSSYAMAEDINYPRLLQKLMEILMECAGADSGCLLMVPWLGSSRGLRKNNEDYSVSTKKWTIEAKGYIIRSEGAMRVDVCHGASWDGSMLPDSVLRYVLRTKKHVVIQNAHLSAGMFDDDPYFKKNTCRSVLCAPIMKQGVVTCLAYLENSQYSDAFAPERVEVLQLLSFPAAISIENSLLYTTYRSLYDNAMDGIFCMTLSGSILQANPALFHILGYKKHMNMEDSGELLFVEEKEKKVLFDMLRKGESVNGYEARIHRVDMSSWFWASLSVNTRKDRRGNVLYCEGMLKDMTEHKERERMMQLRRVKDELERRVEERTTELRSVNESLLNEIEERKKVEKALRDAREEALAAVKAKSSFLANMSHEIRTPLNGIIGLCSLLSGPEMKGEQRDLVETILSCGESLVTTVDSILDYSKADSGSLTLQYHSFDIRSCVDSVVSMCSLQADQKGVEIWTYVDRRVPLFVISDSSQLRRILINFANNAVKFQEKGIVKVIVTYESEKDDMVLLGFAVQDEGIGISDEDMKKLFKPFSQADGSTTRKYGGTGLGLAICKKLAQLLGTSIKSVSRVGEGTTFSFDMWFKKEESVDKEMSILSRVGLIFINNDEWKSKCFVEYCKSAGCASVYAVPTQEAMLGLLPKFCEQEEVSVINVVTEGGIDGNVLRELREKASDVAPRVSVRIVRQISHLRAANGHTTKCDGVLITPLNYTQLRNMLLSTIAMRRGSLYVDSAQPSPEIMMDKEMMEEGDEGVIDILVVEDNDVNQKVICRILKKADLGYELAVNGQEAVDITEKQLFRVVLMDLQMPVMGGLEATRIIREREQIRGGRERVPIIALTAEAMIGDREKCLAVGMDDYISKPVRPKVLLCKINDMLSQR